MDWKIKAEVRIEAHNATEAHTKVHGALIAIDEVKDVGFSGIEAVQQPSIWKPISSAPKDGTKIIGYSPPVREARTVSWDHDRKCWETIDHDVYEPTVWIHQRP
jgi:hypothetical protein